MRSWTLPLSSWRWASAACCIGMDLCARRRSRPSASRGIVRQRQRARCTLFPAASIAPCDGAGACRPARGPDPPSLLAESRSPRRPGPAGSVIQRRNGRSQRRENRQDQGAELPVDPDRVPRGCRVHEAMVRGGRVNRHHRDPVTTGLTRAADRQQLHFPRALHGRGAVTGLKLGVDVPDMGVDRVHRHRQLAGDLGPGQVRREVAQDPQLGGAELFRLRR